MWVERVWQDPWVAVFGWALALTGVSTEASMTMLPGGDWETKSRKKKFLSFSKSFFDLLAPGRATSLDFPPQSEFSAFPGILLRGEGSLAFLFKLNFTLLCWNFLTSTSARLVQTWWNQCHPTREEEMNSVLPENKLLTLVREPSTLCLWEFLPEKQP